MSFSVQQSKAELAAVLHGTTLSQVENISGVYNRAARQLMLDIDPQETKRVQQLASPIFYQVFDYAPPDDLKGNKIIDIFPQINRYPGDRFTQTYNQSFDLNKNNTYIEGFTILLNQGIKTLRLNYLNSSQAIILNTIGAITGNGTWVASGTASNLLVNTSTIINGSNALQFDVATGTGYLTNSTMNPVDLTNHENLSTLFFELYKNIPAYVTSVDLRFGSDAANYWEITGLNTNYQGTSFVQGWDTLGQVWTGLTQTGTPDVTQITYARIGITVSANSFGLQLAQLWSKLGTIMSTEYYSKFLFSDALTGAWQATTTDDSNLINLDVESYNIYQYLVQLMATQQALGQVAGYDTVLSDTWYQKAIIRYKRMYKSEVSKPQVKYYTKTFAGYNNYFGTNFQSY